MKNVAILGATGSIGRSTLDVVARHRDRYRVFALSAATRVDELADLCIAFAPRYAAMPDPHCAARLAQRLRQAGCDTQVLHSVDSLEMIAAHADTDVVMAAIVGAAGLASSLAAACAGKTVLLANKEALVMSGALFMAAVRDHGATLLPIDSEHNAVFQCLPRDFSKGWDRAGVDKIVLTASGGPFRARAPATLAEVAPAEAVAHPNWSMGRKISVDSATMMNKGLEVIEAHWLFGVPAERIEIVVHPQSVVHSMVHYRDGSVMAQLGNPDMRTPIAYGLSYPERIEAGVAALDLTKVAKLEFEPLSFERFPCAQLAYRALALGGTAPAILNAANEVAVDAFLGERLGFLRIAEVIEETLMTCRATAADDLAAILAADAAARETARRLVGRHASASHRAFAESE